MYRAAQELFTVVVTKHVWPYFQSRFPNQFPNVFLPGSKSGSDVFLATTCPHVSSGPGHCL
jgi:hypothetical protein